MPYPPLKMTASTVVPDCTPKGLVSLVCPAGAEVSEVLVPVPEVAQDASDPVAAKAAAASEPRRKSRRPSGLTLMSMSCPFRSILVGFVDALLEMLDAVVRPGRSDTLLGRFALR